MRWTQDDFSKAGQDPKFSAPLFWEMQWPNMEDVIEQIAVHPRLGDGYLQVVKRAVENT